MVGASQTRVLVLAGNGAVAAGGIAAAVGSWITEVNLRDGVIPWAFGLLRQEKWSISRTQRR